MNYTNIFYYNPENIALAIPDLTQAIIIAVIGGVWILVVFYLCILLAGISWVFNDKREVIRRKRVLSDLILMKDIQTELEKEIEQATLKAAFQDE